MADEYVSDEENYANDSFENDTDLEDLDPVSANASESESELEQHAQKPDRHTYQRNRFNEHSRTDDYAPYTSSSDDDDSDVVVKQTIAEINTEPMHMEDAILTPKEAPTVRNTAAAASVKANNVKEITNEQVSERPEELQLESESQIESESEPPGSGMDVSGDHSHRAAPLDLFMETPEPAELIEPADIFDSNSEYIDKAYIETMNKNFETREFFGDELARFELTKEDGHFEALPDVGKYSRQFSPHSNRSSKSASSLKVTEIEVPRLPIDQQIDLCISSHTPSSFNADDYAFHMNFEQNQPTKNSKMRSSQRKSWSFTNERMREIERQNQILLKKILSQKGSYLPKPNKSTGNMHNIPITSSGSSTRQATSALNRKKQQRQIDLDNQILKRKIEAIAFRRPHML